MKTALLIDGAFMRKKFRAALKRDITAPDVRHAAPIAAKYRVYCLVFTSEIKSPTVKSQLCCSDL
jgi:hypothetical protein